jgi:hypothetical protein
MILCGKKHRLIFRIATKKNGIEKKIINVKIMIKKAITTIILLMTGLLTAQVGIGTTTPNDSAVLELYSNSKGFLPTRVTSAQKAAIVPVEGLLVFDTDIPCYSIYQNGAWHCLDTKNEIVLGTITSFDCASVYTSNTLTQNVAAQNTIFVLPYTGGSGGYYSAATIASTGVTGLTAKLFPGIVANGNGTLTYYVTGTPQGSGSATFAVNFGGSSCTISLPVTTFATSPSSNIDSVLCSSATTTHNTILTGKEIPNGYTFSLPYTGGDGSTFSGTITSYSHPSVLATAAPQYLSPSGGTIMFTLSGVPATEGIVNFSIAIGNKTCVYSGITATRGVIYSNPTASTSLTVPNGVNKVTIKSWGAAGKSDGGYYGGYGGYVKATVSVTPSETLTIRVGGGGTAGTTALNGGGNNGGGGYSGVFRGSTPLVIAGGGGGTGNNDEVTAGRQCSYIYGGSAGYPNGYAGGRFANGATAGTGYDTTGGTQTAGGIGGNSTNGGTAYQGGAGFTGGSFLGGGGGGGYFGGGGGTNRTNNVSGDDGGGGGAGGSGYVISSATNVVTAAQATCVSTATVAAPASNDIDYGTGTPAKPINNQNGSNGRIVILYEY